jgi:hypothetical protein
MSAQIVHLIQRRGNAPRVVNREELDRLFANAESALQAWHDTRKESR